MGTWSGSTFDNDHALDVLDALAEASADDQAARIEQILECWAAFVKRHELGLAPRLQTEAERVDSVRCFVEGISSSNAHVDSKLIDALIETMRADRGVLIVDDGVEEVQALLTIAELMAISAKQSKVRLPARYGVLKEQRFEQDTLLRVRNALGFIIKNASLRDLFDTVIAKTATRLAQQLEEKN